MCASKYRYSIIIPHYNIPQGLRRLLESIGSHAQLQVIVVDDRSDRFLEEYHKVVEEFSDRGVQFYRNEGVKGAGTCRNLGLQYARGKWILFSDADDFFWEGYYERLEQYFDSKAELIYFAPKSICIPSGEPSTRHQNYEKKIKDYLQAPTEVRELHLKYDHASPWSKMLLREMLVNHGLQFEEIMYSNDSLFSIQSSFYAQSIAASDACIYCLTDREGSLTKAVKKDAVLIRFEAFIRGAVFLKKHLSRSQWKELNVNAMVRLMILYQQGIGLMQVMRLSMKCLIHGIPFLDLSQINGKTVLSTVLQIQKSNRKKG